MLKMDVKTNFKLSLIVLQYAGDAFQNYLSPHFDFTGTNTEMVQHTHVFTGMPL